MQARVDVVVVGAGHNGLVAAALLARAGLDVLVLEAADVLGGAARTEHPFPRAPEVGASTGAYLLGPMPPEILRELDVTLPLRRRDPHGFLVTPSGRSLLLGAEAAATRRELVAGFSARDAEAHEALGRELAALRDDLAPAWLSPPLSLEETAERHLRPALRKPFLELCRGPISLYLDRFGFQSDLLRAMHAVTDAFPGTCVGYDDPGSGMNFLVHNMCRLPGSDGTWMVVEGGMGTLTRTLAGRATALGARIVPGRTVVAVERAGGAIAGVALAGGETIAARAVVSNADPFRTRALLPVRALPPSLDARLDELARDGTSMKVNLCLAALPRFRARAEAEGAHRGTIHLLEDEGAALDALRRAHAEAMAGELPERPAVEMYLHTAVDPSLAGGSGRHSAALFVQWVPYAPSGGRSWTDLEEGYAGRLLAHVDRFAPGTSSLVVDMQVLSPPGIERRFGITRGHIHHVDNAFGFDRRAPYRFGIEGLYLCGAGTHPAGSVIGAGGYNAARIVLEDLAG